MITNFVSFLKKSIDILCLEMLLSILKFIFYLFLFYTGLIYSGWSPKDGLSKFIEVSIVINLENLYRYIFRYLIVRLAEITGMSYDFL